MARYLYWYRNTLRTSDLLPVHLSSSDELFMCYILDQRMHEISPIGLCRTGESRKRFLLDALQELNAELIKLGGNLIIRSGSVTDQLKHLLNHLHIDTLIYNKELGIEEQTDEQHIEKYCHQIQIKTITTNLNFFTNFNQLPFEITNTPKIFTEFRKKIEETQCYQLQFQYSVLSCSPGESERLPHSNQIIPLQGGCVTGKKRIHEYIHDKQLARSYKQTRNELLGLNFSTKFSPYLAIGCISPSQIHTELTSHEKEFGSNESTYWIKFELLWRDFFRYVFLQHRYRIFCKSGLSINRMHFD
ncbi:MAG: deoxyribodipyrimidine photo-lyase, partial [Bacteroidota bacterium]